MKKLGLVLTMAAMLLTGCARQETAALETVEDGLRAAKSEPYTIVFTAPEDVTQETFGEDGAAQLYRTEDGSCEITTEVLDATSVDEAVEALSGIPAAQLTLTRLRGRPVPEYRFAWASAGEEGETVSACALLTTEDYYYAVTVTEPAGRGAETGAAAEAVFSSVSLEAERTV